MFWQPDSDEFISQGYVGHVKVVNGKTLICCVCYVWLQTKNTQKRTDLSEMADIKRP